MNRLIRCYGLQVWNRDNLGQDRSVIYKPQQLFETLKGNPVFSSQEAKKDSQY